MSDLNPKPQILNPKPTCRASSSRWRPIQRRCSAPRAAAAASQSRFRLARVASKGPAFKGCVKSQKLTRFSFYTGFIYRHGLFQTSTLIRQNASPSTNISHSSKKLSMLNRQCPFFQACPCDGAQKAADNVLYSKSPVAKRGPTAVKLRTTGLLRCLQPSSKRLHSPCTPLNLWHIKCSLKLIDQITWVKFTKW